MMYVRPEEDYGSFKNIKTKASVQENRSMEDLFQIVTSIIILSGYFRNSIFCLGYFDLYYNLLIL